MSSDVYNILNSFAYVPKDMRLKDLSELAEKEDWNYRHKPSKDLYPILYNYLYHTFARLQEEEKIVELSDGSVACFNTGLVTPNQEEIFGYFTKNKNEDRQPWFLAKFCKESDKELLDFEILPDIAHYFDEPSELLFDPKLELRKNIDHIIGDNRNRFPEEFQTMESDYSLRITLDGAIEQAIKRVRRNYKTAIPQYYQGRVQLLLPLCLRNPSVADLALVIYQNGNVYLSSTCLTLDQAYNNARLLAKPDTEWLNP